MTKAEEAALEKYPKSSGKIRNMCEFDWIIRRDCERQAFQKGYEQAERDLLSNAVDAEIVKDIHNLLHVKSAPLPMPSEYHFGDKVKIIILSGEYK